MFFLAFSHENLRHGAGFSGIPACSFDVLFNFMTPNRDNFRSRSIAKSKRNKVNSDLYFLVKINGFALFSGEFAQSFLILFLLLLVNLN
jgi:hypothetical protein